jgi:hypothetical protein
MSTPESNIYITIKKFIKIYPKFSRLYIYNEPIRIRQSGYEEINNNNTTKGKSLPTTTPKAEIESLRRTKTKISDIVICNDFQIFCTFTFKADRQNVQLCKKKMSKWLENQSAAQSPHALKYIIVPEYHKDGESIHFHALMKDYNFRLTDSGKKIKGRKCYNISSYQSGFSTVVKIDDIEKVSSYIKKYITKDMPHFSGKKRYWCSTHLKRPLKVQNPLIKPKSEKKFKEVYAINNLTILQKLGSIKVQANKEGAYYGNSERRQCN